jgi:hypothetical protein
VLDFLGRGGLRCRLRFVLKLRLILRDSIRFRLSTETRRQRLRVSDRWAHDTVRGKRGITIGVEREGLTHGEKARIKVIPLWRHHSRQDSISTRRCDRIMPLSRVLIRRKLRRCSQRK